LIELCVTKESAMRTQSLVLPLAVLLAGCSLLDRKSPSQPPSPKTQVAPVTAVTHGVADADYHLARYYQGRNLQDEAIAAYGRALAANPANAEAHNGLAVIYAGRGRYDDAETELKAAIALAPKAAHLQNNLGYCYLLQGRYDDALIRFREAQVLDPGNLRLAENIALAEASGKDRQTGPGPAVPMPPAPPSSGTVAATPPKAVRSPGLVEVAPNIYELPARRPSATPDAAPHAIANVTPRQPLMLKELEVANGNGITGMARRTARYLSSHQIGARTRITNQKPYLQTQTEIQYRPGYEQQARSLNGLLVKPTRLVASEHLRPSVSLRVVLGRDVARRPLFAETAAGPVVASLGGEGAP
jgi:tetratricopeptide (TPR) repeat protein